MGRVEGKIAIVTGGGTGIGRAAATRLAEEGAKVIIAEFNGETGQAAADELGKVAAFIQHDVRDEGSWQSLMDAVAGDHGRPDILINNAGILATTINQTLRQT
ncbi:MAG: SDR family NAD(P)-dependent oxidoreductase, partial [Alphaproteobacteria bacterium]|nr:SDR family NAD(P)-dependent oxidoreductase [Alphaproteobacteria bacterium]